MLRRGAHRGQTGAVDVVDLAECRVGNDVDDGARCGLLTVGRRERRPRVLLELTEIQALVIESVPQLMLAARRDDVRGFRLRLPVVAAIAGLIETETACDHARGHAEIANLPLVNRRGFQDAIERTTERGIDQKPRTEDAVISNCLIMAAVLERAVPGSRLIQQRRGPLGPKRSGGGIAEDRTVEPMDLGRLPRALGSIVRQPSVSIDAAERGQRKIRWRGERRGLPLRIDGSEEEQAIPENRSAGGHARVAQTRGHGVDGALDAPHRIVGRLERVGP